jgi:hypothetical protein
MAAVVASAEKELNDYHLEIWPRGCYALFLDNDDTEFQVPKE